MNISDINIKIKHSVIAALAIILMVSCSSSKTASLPKPVTREATVSADNPFTEKMQLPFDDKGVELTFNMSFDEADNILTLNIVGTRRMVVFRQDIEYNKVFCHPFLGSRRLRPEKLPYSVLVLPKTKLQLDSKVWKTFSKPRNNHLFNKWLENISYELKMIYPSMSAGVLPDDPLIADSIVQRFKVRPNATKASFTLRNILFADFKGEPASRAQLKRNPKKSKKCTIKYDQDLDLTYNVKIRRDPCFGTQARRDTLEKHIEEIVNSYHNLIKETPNGTVGSVEAQEIFYQHRQFLLSRYLENTDSSACHDLQADIDKYNSYVDSISNASCTYVKPVEETESGGSSELSDADGGTNAGQSVTGGRLSEAGVGLLGIGVSPRVLLDAAHRIDDTVAKFVMSSDMLQMHDLIRSGQEIIRLTNKNARDKGIINDEQRKAFKEFKKAEAYFKKVVLKQ